MSKLVAGITENWDLGLLRRPQMTFVGGQADAAPGHPGRIVAAIELKGARSALERDRC